MTSSPDRAGPAPREALDALPPALPAMWRLCRLGYRHEPALMLVAFVLSLLSALPDALMALWFKLLGDGVLHHDRRLLVGAAMGLGVSSTATWFLRTVSTRVQRRFRDKVTIALESHVAGLLASIATIAHHERPDYLDRLSVLRNQIFVLDHMYMSVFATCGWILRLGVTVALLASIHPALVLLAVFALPTVLTSTWRPGVEREAQERGAQSARLSRHLFATATTAAAGKEVRVLGIGNRLVDGRRAAWERWYGPVAAARWGSAAWHALAWAVFAAAYVGAVVFVSTRAGSTAGDVLLVLAAGSRLSAYIGATVGEIGFLHGIWMDGSRRLAWLEDYAASLAAAADRPVPAALQQGIRLDRVSFSYPGTSRVVLDDVSLFLPAGAVVAVVGENGAGKTTLVKLLAKMYEPTSGSILVDGTPLARVPAEQWRARMAGAFQDFFRFEFSARHSVGLGDVPRMDDDAGRARSHRARRCRRHRRAPAGRARHPVGADVARRRRGLLRPVAEARAGARLHARRPAAARPRRTDGGARRRDRARAVRALCRRGARQRRGRADHDPRVAPLLDGAHGRPDRGPRRRPPGRDGLARRADGARRPVLAALRHPGQRVSLIARFDLDYGAGGCRG
jgi:ATP-binding cassette subfamily B protein